MSDLAALLVAALRSEAGEELVDELADRVAEGLALRIGVATADGWMDAPTAAAYLGFESVSTLHKLTAARKIPFYQDGPNAKCWFKRSELDEWRAKTRVPVL